MALGKVVYVGQSVADTLLDSVQDNLERYLYSGFEDLVEQGNWSISTDVTYDSAPLKDLDPKNDAEAEKKNSILVWKSLKGLTPSLATENRIWVRLTHVECLGFCRERWLKNKTTDDVVKSVKIHFFANTRNRWRDDNAISRLWWNYWIAQRMMPNDPEKALDIMLRVLDMRLSTVERPTMFIRPKIAAGVFRTFAHEEWLLKENRWRSFMIALNKLGAGEVFEAMSESEIDAIMQSCLKEAKAAHV